MFIYFWLDFFFNEPLRQLLLLDSSTSVADLRKPCGARRELFHLAAGTLSLAGKEIQKNTRATDRYGLAELLLKSAKA